MSKTEQRVFGVMTTPQAIVILGSVLVVSASWYYGIRQGGFESLTEWWNSESIPRPISPEDHNTQIDTLMRLKAVPIDDLSDIPESHRERFIKELMERIAWWSSGSGMSTSDIRARALEIIDAGGYNNGKQSFELWMSEDGYIRSPRALQFRPDWPSITDTPERVVTAPPPMPTPVPAPTAEQPAPAVPPPAEPVEEERVVEKPKAKLIEPNRTDIETAEHNIDQIADRTETKSGTPEQLESLKAFLAEKGMRVTDEEAREIFTRGWYERDGKTYTLWASTERMSPTVHEAVVTHPDGTTSVRRIPLAAFFETPRA